MTTVSFVINTYNRGQYLPNAIRGLRSVKHDQVEVVVVNGPSTDNTEEVLTQWSDQIKIGRCPEANLSQSRNIGISLASGDIIAFIDDDAVPHPSWVRKLLPHYDDPLVSSVGGFTVDNSGVRYQVRKTLCDRFGNAYNVSDFFDERPLNTPGSFYYPSLLGTNSSFRATTLRDIGGFDETFAYLLDETDVCLRLVDAGYKIVYEPEAIIFHQFAPSHIRSGKRIARTLYPSAVSKSYFINRHGFAAAPGKVHEELEHYRKAVTDANCWYADHGLVSWEHHASLDRDLSWGIEKGAEVARLRHAQKNGDLRPTPVPQFVPQPHDTGIRIVFVSRSYPPVNDAGIARWTKMIAEGLAELKHEVHVICEAVEDPAPHIIKAFGYTGFETMFQATRHMWMMGYPGMSDWAMAVDRALTGLKSFEPDVISFPIWDLEGVRALRLPDVGVVMSLHTSYALAKPFKPEWSARPLFEHFVVEPMIRLEARTLARAPVILANSEAIVRDMEAVYGTAIRDRTTIVPHGTVDPLETRQRRPRDDAAPLKVAFVGRFERRKGFDIAAEGFTRVLARSSEVRVTIAGDIPGPSAAEELTALGCADLLTEPRVEWKGFIDRAALDDLYADADVVVMPSRYESFGLVAIEAMAAGACVIALSAGGLTEVVEDGVTGYTVPADCEAPMRIADVVLRLANDRNCLQRMQRNARARFEKMYSVEAMVRGVERVYAQAAQEAKRFAKRVEA